jgi:hypothetical protein
MPLPDLSQSLRLGSQVGVMAAKRQERIDYECYLNAGRVYVISRDSD